MTRATYDALSRLRDLSTETAAGQVLQSFAYTLDDAGKRLRVDEHDGTARTHLFDAADRLTRERVTAGDGSLVFQRDFTYDPVGNRLSQMTEEGGTTSTVTYTYDARDRLLSQSPGPTYSWDDGGNLTGKTPGLDLTWDDPGRLRRLTLDDGSEVRTTYDAFGDRVRTEQVAAGGTAEALRYLVDTADGLSHAVAEVDDSGQIGTLYVRGDQQLLGLHRPGSGDARYFHADGLGSIRSLSDAGGAIADRYSYRAFGGMLEHQGSDPNPYRFAGEPFDLATGLSYNRARWMDPSVGRFLSIDPFQGDLRMPRTLHSYLYAGLDPINLADPTGERFAAVVGVFVAVLAIVALAVIVGPAIFNAIYGKRRLLTAGERAMAATVFGSAIDYNKVRVIKGNYLPYQDVPMSPNGFIYYPAYLVGIHAYSEDFSQERDFEFAATFIHEMTHVWQIQHGIWLKTRRVLLSEDQYGYVMDVNRKFEDYGVEQMGSIVEDYFRLINDLPPAGRKGGPRGICAYKAVIPWLDPC